MLEKPDLRNEKIVDCLQREYGLDELILPPRERDLMYIGGGLLASGRTPQDEERLFYRTYGQTKTDPVIMAYYRYDRIIQDIAIYCQQLLLSDDGGDDRAQSLHYLQSNFRPGGTIEIACRMNRATLGRC